MLHTTAFMCCDLQCSCNECYWLQDLYRCVCIYIYTVKGCVLNSQMSYLCSLLPFYKFYLVNMNALSGCFSGIFVPVNCSLSFILLNVCVCCCFLLGGGGLQSYENKCGGWGGRVHNNSHNMIKICNHSVISYLCCFLRDITNKVF